MIKTKVEKLKAKNKSSKTNKPQNNSDVILSPKRSIPSKSNL